MTYIEELREAASLIRTECCKHETYSPGLTGLIKWHNCGACPLSNSICSLDIPEPALWKPEKIGVEDDE